MAAVPGARITTEPQSLGVPRASNGHGTHLRAMLELKDADWQSILALM
jgi:hypothetical protein